MAEPLEDLAPLDYRALAPQALVRACLDTADELAWQEFVRRFQKLVASVALRTARRWGESSPQIVDELVQETYLKLCADGCRLLRSFHSMHEDAIYGFVKVLTANLVHDHFKAMRSQKRGGRAESEPLDSGGVVQTEVRGKVGGAQEVERDVLIGEIDNCLRSVDQGPNAGRDRRVFWLYYRAGLPASTIAALPTIGLSTKGVESSLLRLTRLVRKTLVRESVERASRSAEGEGIQPSESLS
jgi:RNA polymerase sigma-70 factor (ECF subfamily)